jgi:hypothetical protein
MLKKIIKAYTQKRQWHTNRKIVVFESDDWGSGRMPDLATYKRLEPLVPGLSKDYYASCDSIEGVADLEMLFETLLKYKDSNGNNPVITANAIMANPDYKKIREAGFEEYFYEPFYTTIRALDDGQKILDLWKYGMDEKIFHPQFHGREHVLAPLWLHELRSGNQPLLAAFNEGVFSVPVTSQLYTKRRNLQAAFDYSGADNDTQFQGNAIREGMKIFSDYFGFNSKSFIASAYIWNRAIEQTLYETGVKYIQGLAFQYEPKTNSNSYSKRLHYTGQNNRRGQKYLVRNAFFEPSSNVDFDWVSDCMRRIEKAFACKSPAIIGVHRVNFIGTLLASNRDNNIILFDQLLRRMTAQWPEIEFMSSDQLGDLI